MNMIFDKNVIKAEEELKELFSDKVKTDELSKILYSYDASTIKAKPYGVMHVSNIEEISKIIKILHKYSVPFTPRCAGTNLSGGATNQKGGFIINLAGCDKIHQIDTSNNVAVVEPGVVNLKLQEELEKFGFFYPPDPASQKVSTIGGNIGENAGGPRCIKYGVTLNNVIKLEIVLPDGNEAYFSIDDDGPEIINLFIGSEGTLGIIKKAYLKIIPIPKFRGLVYAEFDSLENTMKTVEEIIKNGIIPSAMEAMDKITLDLTSKEELDEKVKGILIIEIDADSEEDFKIQIKKIEKILSIYSLKLKYADKKEEMEELFRIRKDAYPSLAKIANNILVEDGCVPRSNLTETVRDIQKLLKDKNLNATLVFHAGDGNIHPNIIFDERDIKDTNRIRRIAYQILDIYIKHNGTVSAEHGVGVEKRGYIAIQHNKEVIEILKNIKKTIDEKNISNPDKKIPLNTEIPKTKNKLKSEISSEILTIKKEIESRFKSKIKSIIISNEIIQETYGCKILSSSNLKKLIEFDIKNMILIAESGTKMKVLNEFLETEKFKTYPYEGTIGGLIANGKYHQIRDILQYLEVILSDGRIIELGSKNIKDTSIYELMRLFIGSKGTLGFITKVGIKVFKGIGEFNFTQKKMIKNITPIHIKIKKVFDSENLFNPFLTKELYGNEI
ncbi:MAG: FAD-binding oxidoreductase [Elusimicrobiales bacterium]|nr:FAD-binding oxidoreductase [Elusimicrobiales bacterium]